MFPLRGSGNFTPRENNQGFIVTSRTRTAKVKGTANLFPPNEDKEVLIMARNWHDSPIAGSPLIVYDIT
jgi:hypothetical protein